MNLFKEDEKISEMNDYQNGLEIPDEQKETEGFYLLMKELIEKNKKILKKITMLRKVLMVNDKTIRNCKMMIKKREKKNKK